jgi:hypothetical protein
MTKTIQHRSWAYLSETGKGKIVAVHAAYKGESK